MVRLAKRSNFMRQSLQGGENIKGGIWAFTQGTKCIFSHLKTIGQTEKSFYFLFSRVK
jgi:hypothetical protein